MCRLTIVSLIVALLAACAPRSTRPVPSMTGSSRPPNVLLVITDDQGYGDLGFTGNRAIHTPHLDGLARDGVALRRFYVAPVCSPTRASLLTGRYNYRTGVVDTYLGRSMMRPEEVTLAEALAAAGYRTGIFGKWHLGDNAPMRPTDQGFQMALTHKGGGIAQPSDPPGGDGYFDPTVYDNERPRKARGYCTDVFTDGALAFIDRNDPRPFFAYVAYNAPHDPLQAPEPHLSHYRKMGLDETTARVYAMVSNVDDNVGRMLARLAARGLDRDTLVIFLTDNGPAHRGRYNAGLRGHKGSVFDGGIRTVSLLRWPAGRLTGGQVFDGPAAHIDLFPTVLEATRTRAPAPIDGRSLLAALQGRAAWPDRALFFQWHRGDSPELGRAFAVRGPRYKLVSPENKDPAQRRMLLFDMVRDPGETTDLAATHPQQVGGMRTAYETWFREVTSSLQAGAPRIQIGHAQENPAMLTRQDWRGPLAGWADDSIGHWDLDAAAGRYDLRVRFAALATAAQLRVQVGGAARTVSLPAAATEHRFQDVAIPAGATRLEAVLDLDPGSRGVTHVEVLRR